MRKDFEAKNAHGDLFPSPEPTSQKSCLKQMLPGGVWLPVLLAAVAFLVYWPSLYSDFVYDAHFEIFEESFVTSLTNLPDVISLKVLGMKSMLGDRPGQILYLMLNATLWGKEPMGYHLSSNLLHAANVALLFVFMRRLIFMEGIQFTKNNCLQIQVALVAATLFFALHPIATEPVSGIGFSSDLLVAFFTLLTLLAATAFRPNNLRFSLLFGGVGTLNAFAAVACKESGLAATLLLIVYWFLFRRREPLTPWFFFMGATMTATVAFLTARFLLAPPSPYPLSYLGGSFSHVLPIQTRLWVFMMGQLLWPVHLSASYTADDLHGLPAPEATVILTVVILLQYGLASFSRLGAMGVAIYWVGLMTVSNFVPLYRPMADRFYYLSLAGAIMQLVALLMMLLGSPSKFWIMAVLLIATLLPISRLTLIRQNIFSNDFTLWSDTVKVSPLSSTAHCNLGLALYNRGRLREAIAEYQKALDINPTYYEASYNLGLAFLDEGHLDEAVSQYQKVLKINPHDAKAHDNLGLAYFRTGEVDKAIAEYRKALDITPNDIKARGNLQAALLQNGTTR